MIGCLLHVYVRLQCEKQFEKENENESEEKKENGSEKRKRMGARKKAITQESE